MSAGGSETGRAGGGQRRLDRVAQAENEKAPSDAGRCGAEADTDYRPDPPEPAELVLPPPALLGLPAEPPLSPDCARADPVMSASASAAVMIFVMVSSIGRGLRRRGLGQPRLVTAVPLRR